MASMSPRGAALLKTLRATFAALDDHAKLAPGEVDDLASTVVAHIRSWRPQIVGAERLVDLQLVAPTDLEAELAKLRAEVDAMRPIYVLALAFCEAEHTRDSNCSAGDHDSCAAAPAEKALRAAVAKVESHG
ncbi:MAG TPA: hypothetical protein VGG74_21050 [Kofleriaceae bacterium]